MSVVTTLKHPSGSSCQINSIGATVTSFQTGSEEHIFVSKDAIFDGSKAIRGGIPIVFPIFGPSPGSSTMPQHGFARVSIWKLDSSTDTSATYTLELANVTKGRGENNPWSVEEATKNGLDVKLTYEVVLEADSLITTLTAANTGKVPFDMEALLHSYYAVADQAAQDNSKTFVNGLDNYLFHDKVAKTKDSVQVAGVPVSIFGETDRVFSNADKPELEVSLYTPKTKLEFTAEGSGPVSCVVWNPDKEKNEATSDLHNDAYFSFVCVEPGIIGENKVSVEPGKEAYFKQTLKAVKV